jgi:catalase
VKKTFATGHYLLLGLLLAVPLTACTKAKDASIAQVKRTPSSDFSDELDERLGEEKEKNEDGQIKLLTYILYQTLDRDHKAPNVPRDAHAKAHACVRATFKIDNSSLPESLKVGVFAENGREFPAWMRFSNGNGEPKGKDSNGDVRGLAIKLMGVDGDKILESERHERTQDFVMVNSEAFFIKDISNYVEFVAMLNKGNPVAYLVLHPKDFYILLKAQSQKVSNPLGLNFFSSTPYRLGRATSADQRAMKYNVVPCASNTASDPAQPDKKDPDFLRKAMVNHLKGGAACFEFQVQLRDEADPDDMPIEDSTVVWNDHPTFFNSHYSPKIKVATITIPPQEFDTDRQNAFCENLSFTPWHSLPEHRPLGRTNRARRTVYKLISDFRHKRNGMAQREPAPEDVP